MAWVLLTIVLAGAAYGDTPERLGANVQCLDRAVPPTKLPAAQGSWVPGATASFGGRITIMDFDDVLGKAVLYGGYDGVAIWDDTWVYDGASWQMLNAGSARPRSFSGMAYDSSRQSMVLFGGDSQDLDTWELPATTWMLAATAPPPLLPRVYHGLAFDSRRGKCVLFGGHSYSAGDLNDTWEYDGVAWTPGPPAPPGLTPRLVGAMGFDRLRGVTVLFGGGPFYGYPTVADTWEYDGTGWTSIPVFGPQARIDGRMVWFAARQDLAMVGGFQSTCTSSLDDLWFYDGATWTQDASVPGSGRYGQGMAQDPNRSRIVAYGGFDDDHGWLDDTWEYVPCMLVQPLTLPHGLTYASYSQQLSGTGAPPVRFVLESGALPPGLSLATDGLISGTPTVPGSFPFKVRAVDTGTCIITHNYNITIDCGVTISPPSLPGGLVNKPYSVTMTGGGGTSPYAFFVFGALPPGLTLFGSGLLSGTPTTAGTFAFMINVTDAAGCSSAAGYTITVDVRADHLCGEGHGPPNPNRVSVFDGAGLPTPVSFLAYAAGTWGTNVAAGDVDGALDDILTGPGPGDVLGPQVRAFRRDGTSIAKINYYAYGTLRYGVNLSGIAIDGDAFDEILTGPGPGTVFGPHVRGWNCDGISVAAMSRVSFFAYGTLKFGVNVGSGNIEPGNAQEMLTGAGPGPTFSATVRAFAFDGSGVQTISR
ncbi:MAG: putative Ig domain-containing protein [Acidobacteriota bacterium]